MRTMSIGDALVTLHRWDCCEDWREEGSCTGCRKLLAAECPTCRETLVSRSGDLYYEVTEHNDDGNITSCNLVHYDPECLGGVVQNQMSARIEGRAA